MAITSNIEKELDREHEIYTEEPEIRDSLVIKPVSYTHLLILFTYCLNIVKWVMVKKLLKKLERKHIQKKLNYIVCMEMKLNYFTIKLVVKR